MRLTKKFLSLVVCIIMVASLFASTTCAVAAQAKKDVKTLKLSVPASWVGTSGPGSQAIIDLINSKSSTLGAKIQIDKLPEGAAADQVVLVRYAAGQASDLLMYQGVNFFINKMKVENNMVEVGKMGLDILYTNPTSIYSDPQNQAVKGKYYSVPVGTKASAWGVFYNKKVFKAAGVANPPKNWTEMLKACAAIRANNIDPVYIAGKDTWTFGVTTAIVQQLELKTPADAKLWSTGFDTNKKHYADQKYLTAAITELKELKDKGFINKTFLSDTDTTAKQAVVDGTAAMYVMGDWAIADFQKLAGDNYKDIGYMALPVLDTAGWYSNLGQHNMYISKQGNKNIELCKTVVKLMAGVEATNAFFKAQPGIPVMKGVNGYAKGNGCLSDQIAASKTFTFRQYSNVYGWDQNQVTSAIQGLLAGAGTVKEVIDLGDQTLAKAAKAKKAPGF